MQFYCSALQIWRLKNIKELKKQKKQKKQQNIKELVLYILQKSWSDLLEVLSSTHYIRTFSMNISNFLNIEISGL